jgi:hypothetical protein
MLALVIGLITPLVCYIAYLFYFRPKAEMKRLTKLLRDMGYKVHLYPYSLHKV